MKTVLFPISWLRPFFLESRKLLIVFKTRCELLWLLKWLVLSTKNLRSRKDMTYQMVKVDRRLSHKWYRMFEAPTLISFLRSFWKHVLAAFSIYPWKNQTLPFKVFCALWWTKMYLVWWTDCKVAPKGTIQIILLFKSKRKTFWNFFSSRSFGIGS